MDHLARSNVFLLLLDALVVGELHLHLVRWPVDGDAIRTLANESMAQLTQLLDGFLKHPELGVVVPFGDADPRKRLLVWALDGFIANFAGELEYVVRLDIEVALVSAVDAISGVGLVHGRGLMVVFARYSSRASAGMR